ncbi:MAG: Putative cation (Co/Zn/Cd) diffusion facilitator family protein [candidate division Zixibacteria bacterium RBG-1]|nr:MAG: Putative cation (Co/Zn/Cd) diffusion facilitator family protein [candidate division Zixibacteria bacterium RBG-1]
MQPRKKNIAELEQISHFGYFHYPLTDTGEVTLKKKRLLWVVILTATMMVVEFVAGILTNSLALISDAGHMLSHLLALGLSLFAVIFASKQTTKEKSFGFYRLEVIAALINGFTLILITGYIIYHAYLRIIHPESLDVINMFIVASAGLVVNLVSAAILWKVKTADLNIKSAYFHLLTDTISSVAIVIGAIVIKYTDLWVIDPILSVVICIMILIWAKSLIKDSINVLLEAAPKHIKIDEVIVTIKDNVAGVQQVHDVHIWQIATRMYALTCHVVVEDIKVSQGYPIKQKIKKLLKEKYDIGHTNIEFESVGYESR